MRDAWYAIVWLTLLPASVLAPQIGVMLWIWVAMLTPSELLYGPLASVPFNKIVAFTTLAAFMLSPEKKDYYGDHVMWLLGFFVLVATVSWIDPIVSTAAATELYEKLLKEGALVLALAFVMKSRDRIYLVLWAIALSIGFFSVKEGLIFGLTAGGHKVQGSGAFGDNNGMAAAVLMIVPLLYHLSRHSALKWVRLGLLAAIALSLLAVVGTYSRGGFVGMVVLGLFLFKNSRNKVATFLLLAVGGLAVYFLAPDAWFQRVSTINTATDDTSFIHRVNAWKVSLLIAMDHPLFGGGPHAVQRQFVWDSFVPYLYKVNFITTPPPEIGARAAHSIWFEVLGDYGFLGLGLFIGLLGMSLLYCRNIKRMARGVPALAWAGDLARMLEVSIVVYMVTGSALSLAYYELLYIIFALLSRVRRTVKQHLAAEARQPTPASARVDGPAQPSPGRRPVFAGARGRRPLQDAIGLPRSTGGAGS